MNTSVFTRECSLQQSATNKFNIGAYLKQVWPSVIRSFLLCCLYVLRSYKKEKGLLIVEQSRSYLGITPEVARTGVFHYPLRI